jgi:NAD(P)-dependent dehydrogenase (short-subunit alcohol dehydrogenase family)
MRFEGKVALVVGGTLGIGRATTDRLAAEGATVVTGGREESADLAGDVRDDGYAAALVAHAADRHRGLDVVVYSAGIQRYGTVETTDPETWDEVHGVNVRGAYLVSRAAVPVLRARGGGAIVLVSSVQATASQTGVAAYTASKGALSALARAMALDHAGDGIRVNSVAPGSVDTPMLRWAADQFRGDDSAEDVIAEWGRTHPLGRVAEAAEVAAAIAYLASDDARFVTGAELRVDGGLLAGLAVELPE